MNNSKKNLNKWKVNYYPSGTIVIVPENRKKNRPHYYVHGHPGVSEISRCNIAMDICDKLNGKNNTKYNNVYMPRFGNALTISNGMMISATGPTYDRNPPDLDWRQRNRLIDRFRRWRLIRKLYKCLIK